MRAPNQTRLDQREGMGLALAALRLPVLAQRAGTIGTGCVKRRGNG
jgi:hypothetical protein